MKRYKKMIISQKFHFFIAIFLSCCVIFFHHYMRTTAFDFTLDEVGQELRIRTYPLTIFTSEERCINNENQIIPCRQLTGVENGDILITKSSFTLFFRHGHVGLVVDAEEGVVIEAIGHGNRSTLKPLDRWNYYPTVQILRLRENDVELIDQLTTIAKTEFLDIPYSIFPSKTDKSRTHCSALIWKIFNLFNIDLNSTGGRIVIPRDIANSPYLKIIESHGFGVEESW